MRFPRPHRHPARRRSFKRTIQDRVVGLGTRRYLPPQTLVSPEKCRSADQSPRQLGRHRLGLKQGLPWPPLHFSVSALRRLARTFAPGDIVSSWRGELQSAEERLVDGRLASSSQESLQNVERPSLKFGAGGPQTFRPETLSRDAFCRLSTSLKAILSLSKDRGDASGTHDA